KRSRTTLVRSSPLVKSKRRRRLVSGAKDAGAKKLYLDGIFADDELQKSPGSPAFLFSLGHAGSARANPVSNGSASRQLACNRITTNLGRCRSDRTHRIAVAGTEQFIASRIAAPASSHRSLATYSARSGRVLPRNRSTRRSDSRNGDAELLAAIQTRAPKTIEIRKRARSRIRSCRWGFRDTRIGRRIFPRNNFARPAAGTWTGSFAGERAIRATSAGIVRSAKYGFYR